MRVPGLAKGGVEAVDPCKEKFMRLHNAVVANLAKRHAAAQAAEIAARPARIAAEKEAERLAAVAQNEFMFNRALKNIREAILSCKKGGFMPVMTSSAFVNLIKPLDAGFLARVINEPYNCRYEWPKKPQLLSLRSNYSSLRAGLLASIHAQKSVENRPFERGAQSVAKRFVMALNHLSYVNEANPNRYNSKRHIKQAQKLIQDAATDKMGLTEFLHNVSDYLKKEFTVFADEGIGRGLSMQQVVQRRMYPEQFERFAKSLLQVKESVKAQKQSFVQELGYGNSLGYKKVGQSQYVFGTIPSFLSELGMSHRKISMLLKEVRMDAAQKVSA